jgi:hypothetical protein
MTLDLEIRDWLARYLDGDISLRQFREWFVPASWNVHQTGNVAAGDLVGEIGLRLAEFTSGHRSEEDVQSLLRPLVERYTVSDPVRIEHTTSNVTTRNTITLPSLSVGTARVGAFS